MDLARLIEDTRRRLMGGVATEDTINLLGTDYTPGSGSLTFKYPLNALQAGTRISVGLTTFHIWSVSESTLAATVTAGVDGSPDIASPAGTTVRVRPRWTDWEILRDLNDDLADLSSPLNGLYQVLTTEFPYNLAVRGYDLGALNVLSVLDVRYQTPGPPKDWPRVTRWRLDRNADTNDFPSGLALRLDSGAYAGRPVQVLYRAPFNPFDIDTPDTTTDVATTGLPTTAYDLPPIGAAIRLQTGVDIERTRLDTQGDTRRGDEVAVQSPGMAVRALQQLRQQRINAEVSRLAQMYPARYASH
jgi:hypothetical protein